MLALKMEGGYEPRSAGGLYELEKARYGFFLRASRRNTDLLTPRFLPSETCWTPELQKCKIIHFCCLKPLSVWKFFTVAMEN